MKKLLLIFVLICAAGSALLLALQPDDASIGVIGGADGPTAIFVAGDPTGLIVAAVLAVVAVAAAAVLLIRRKKG